MSAFTIVYPFHQALELRRTPERGRGVFARRDLGPREVIEIAPVMVISPDEAAVIDDLTFTSDVYRWRREPDRRWSLALVGGLGFFFNHSYEPNAVYERVYEDETIVFRALRAIRAGDEVFIDYNGDPASRDPV